MGLQLKDGHLFKTETTITGALVGPALELRGLYGRMIWHLLAISVWYAAGDLGGNGTKEVKGTDEEDRYVMLGWGEWWKVDCVIKGKSQSMDETADIC